MFVRILTRSKITRKVSVQEKMSQSLRIISHSSLNNFTMTSLLESQVAIEFFNYNLLKRCTLTLLQRGVLEAEIKHTGQRLGK